MFLYDPLGVHPTAGTHVMMRTLGILAALQLILIVGARFRRCIQRGLRRTQEGYNSVFDNKLVIRGVFPELFPRCFRTFLGMPEKILETATAFVSAI